MFRGLSYLSPDHQCSQARVRFDLPLIPSSLAHTEIALVSMSCAAPWWDPLCMLLLALLNNETALDL